MAFYMQRQSMDYWCWAAVAVSVNNYFRQAAPRTQCDVASKVLRRGCCKHPPMCNFAYALQDALREVECLDPDLYGAGVIPLRQIREEIDLGFPVAARIGWRGGGGHFVVIAGYVENTELITIADPADGSMTDMPYPRFARNYRSLGRWTDTFLLRDRP